MLFSLAKAKVAEVDAKYDLSTAAAAAAAAAATSVAAATSAAAATAVCKAQAAVSAVATRLDSMTPQEREKLLAARAVVTAHVLQVVGGPKTRAAVCAAATLAAVSTQVSNSNSSGSGTAAAPPSATTAAGGAPPGFSDSSGLTEIYLLEVLASVPAGYKMLVHVDGLGDFQVTVPAGVRVGEPFTFEAEAPIDKQPSDAPIESVPMGLPVQTEQQMPMGIPVPMAAQRLPCPPRLSQSQAGAGTSGVLRTGLAQPDLGREAARRMQRQRDREGSRSTSPKGHRDQNTQRSDYELADQLQLDAVIAASLADAPSTRRSLPQPCARRLDYDLDATIAASLTLAIAT